MISADKRHRHPSMWEIHPADTQFSVDGLLCVAECTQYSVPECTRYPVPCGSWLRGVRTEVLHALKEGSRGKYRWSTGTGW